MPVKRLKINNLRNISASDLTFCQEFNFFYGQNGSGKTSIIEALYFLGLNRSFRSHLNQRIISFDQEHFSLFAELEKTTIGIQKSINKLSVVKASGNKLKSAAELAQLLPILLVNSDSFLYLNAGSQLRRQLLDWILFHVEPGFVGCWQRYKRTLKQRNQAIKNQEPISTIRAWDHDLIENEAKISDFRQKYAKILKQKLILHLSKLSLQLDVEIDYYDGGVAGRQFSSLLEENIHRDMSRGYTQYGAHRADLLIKTHGGVPAKDIFSRGQQKAFLIAVILSQLDIVVESTQKRPILLIDDIAAELDGRVLARVIEYLKSFNIQTFITTINIDDIDLTLLGDNLKVFHVEHGGFTSQ